MSKTIFRLWGWRSKAAKAATRRPAFYDELAGFTAVNTLGALGFGAYHYKYYQAKLQAQIDHHFGARSSGQQMPQEAKINEEMDTEEPSTTGLVGLLQAHWKAVEEGFKEDFAAVNQKIQERKDKEANGCEECLCRELKRMQSEANAWFLTRYLTSA